MTKTFYILDSFLLPTGYNHMFMIQKIARGFSHMGFSWKVIDSINELKEPGFVMISDHPVYFSLGSRHNKNGNVFRLIPGVIQRLNTHFSAIGNLSVALQIKAYKELASQINGKNSIAIPSDKIGFLY